MNKYYAVAFDNDPDFPGQLQFCSVESPDEYLEGGCSNITGDIKQAEDTRDLCKNNFPQFNYRVIELTLRDLV